ncbi:hypothetical protein QWA68_011878 [Fusarium oxysporum]|nr:hypothetical protein QWA68_011878 [Fusarium oxysporum]
MSDQSPCAILPESIDIPRITSTKQESTLNYYGPVDASLPTEASKFLARNTDAVEQELEPSIKAFLKTTQNDCSGLTEEKKACWLTIRITKPCTAFKIPRWHQDGPMFEYDQGREDVVRSKYALTLLGPSTLMLQPDEHVFTTQHEAEARYYWWQNKTDGPEPSEDEMYEADDLLRESLGNAFKDTPRVQVGHGQVVRFSWGRDDSPVHSEPDLVSDRVFMTVLYGSESELRTMKGSLSAIDAFIQHKNFSPTDRDATRQTPLHWVKHCKDQEVACAIVEKLAQWGVPLDAEAESQWGDWHGGTALNMLIGRRKFEPAVKLLQLGADPTIQQVEDGCLRLLDNCIEGRDREDMSNCSPDRAERRREAGLELLNLLIQKGVDPGRPRELGRSHDLENLDLDEPRPLLSALIMSDARCIKVLLDAGAMAREAIYENHHDNLLRDFVEMMVDAMEEGISLREMRDEVESRKESVCLLLDGGARIDSRDGQYSALSKACEIEQGFGIVSFLAENATRRNVEVEYVVALRDTYRRDEPVWEKLDRFYHKLMAEKNDREGMHDIKESA